MRHIQGPLQIIKVPQGRLIAPMLKAPVRVGDRLIPSQVEVDFPGTPEQPMLHMFIEVIDAVPQCTEITLEAREGGAAVRLRDLQNIPLETWIETFVGIFAAQVVGEDEKTGEVTAIERRDDDALRGGVKAVATARAGSRRAMTADRKQRVAHIYNDQPSGGLEAVAVEFGVSRSTAARYVKAARDAGLISGRAK